MIQAIDKITPINQSAKTEETGATLDDNIFGSIFRSAIENVKTTSAEKTQMEYLLATGQLDNPAEYTIAAAESSLALDLLVQLRTRALDAYKELININM